MLIGRWHTSYVHSPIPFVTTFGRNKVDPHGELWRAVLESTKQPAKLFLAELYRKRMVPASLEDPRRGLPRAFRAGRWLHGDRGKVGS